MSHRLAADANNETLMFFALSLTEEIVPFLWGFKMPGANVVTAALANQSFYILFAAGLFLTAVLLWGMRRRISGLRLEFSVATFALLSVLFAYFSLGTGMVFSSWLRISIRFFSSPSVLPVLASGHPLPGGDEPSRDWYLYWRLAHISSSTPGRVRY